MPSVDGGSQVFAFLIIAASVIAAIVTVWLLAVAATRRPSGTSEDRAQVLAQHRAMTGEPAAEGEPAWDGTKRTISTGESGAGLI